MKSQCFKSTEMALTVSQNCEPGIHRNGDFIIYRIDNIPDETPVGEIYHKFYYSVIVPFNKFIFDYAELGFGKILN